MTVTLVFFLSIVAVVALAWFFWPRIGPWFSDSETLFWARLQMFAGVVLTVLATTDLSPVFGAAGLGKWAPVWVVISGIVTEVARRSRASDV